MEFRIGDIRASCRRCGGTQFDDGPCGEGSGPWAEYRCRDCGRLSQYCQLIVQIGDEAVRRARQGRALLRG